MTIAEWLPKRERALIAGNSDAGTSVVAKISIAGRS